MIRAVLDTNVYISALFWKGTPHQVLKKGLGGGFVIVTSPAILDEVRDRLHYKFEFPHEDANAFLEIILVHTEIVETWSSVRIVKTDPKDDKIVACALDGEAQFIVSGDRDLLDIKSYRDINMVSPAQFLKKL